MCITIHHNPTLKMCRLNIILYHLIIWAMFKGVLSLTTAQRVNSAVAWCLRGSLALLTLEVSASGTFDCSAVGMPKPWHLQLADFAKQES